MYFVRESPYEFLLLMLAWFCIPIPCTQSHIPVLHITNVCSNVPRFGKLYAERKEHTYNTLLTMQVRSMTLCSCMEVMDGFNPKNFCSIFLTGLYLMYHNTICLVCILEMITALYEGMVLIACMKGVLRP